MALKRVTFHGDSLDRLRDFPEDARREAGHELYQVQNGRDPSNWKPMSTIGAGVREIRIREGMSRSLLNIAKRSLPRLTLRGVGLTSKNAVG
jgi:phage-related protein